MNLLNSRLSAIILAIGNAGMGQSPATAACLDHWFGIDAYSPLAANEITDMMRLHDELKRCMWNTSFICPPFDSPWHPEAMAAVAWYGKSIILFDDYWDLPVGRRVNYLLHELTHVCIDTVDHGYFLSRGTVGDPDDPPTYWRPPDQSTAITLSGYGARLNADTYVYFMRCLHFRGVIT